MICDEEATAGDSNYEDKDVETKRPFEIYLHQNTFTVYKTAALNKGSVINDASDFF